MMLAMAKNDDHLDCVQEPHVPRSSVVEVGAVGDENGAEVVWQQAEKYDVNCAMALVDLFHTHEAFHMT